MASPISPTFSPAFAVSTPMPKSYLTDDALLESLISDIPFLAVGLLGFAIPMFLCILHKATWPTFFVIGAIFMAFVGSIFDFNQLLARSNGTIYLSMASPLITIREVTFTFSICLRYFYFWYYSNIPPSFKAIRFDPITTTGPRSFLPSNEWKNGSWTRWGVAGRTIYYLLFAIIVAIGILQLVWRVSASFNRTVYQIDSYFQITLSVVLLVKLLFNCFTLPVLRRNFRDASGILVAILLGIAIAIGNLVSIRFSESSLGRFIQAIQLYTMAFFVLVAAFKVQDPRASIIEGFLDQKTRAAPPFQGIGAPGSISTFRITAPTVSTPERHPTPGNELPQASPARLSTADRLATWLTTRISGYNVDATDPMQARAGNQTDLESMSPMQSREHRSSTISSSATPSPVSLREITSWKDSKRLSAIPPTSHHVSSSYSQPSLGFRVTQEFTENIDESPVRDAHGSGTSSEKEKGTTPVSSESDFLTRQHAELESSVAALRSMFPNTRISKGASSSSNLPTGASYHSEFSLSHFPEPPAGTDSFMPKPNRRTSHSTFGPAPEVKDSVVMDDIEFTMIQPPILPRSVTSSINGNNSIFSRLDVTSFIGGLSSSSPDSNQVAQSAATNEDQVVTTKSDSSQPTTSSSVGEAIVVDMSEKPLSRVRFMAPSLETRPVAGPSRTPINRLAGTQVPISGLQTIPSPTTYSPTTYSPSSTRRFAASSRLPISGPIGRIEPSKPFERPRPVPVLLNSKQAGEQRGKGLVEQEGDI